MSSNLSPSFGRLVIDIDAGKEEAVGLLSRMEDIGRGPDGRMTGLGPAKGEARELVRVPAWGGELVVMLITLTLASLLLPAEIGSGEPVVESFEAEKPGWILTKAMLESCEREVG